MNGKNRFKEHIDNGDAQKQSAKRRLLKQLDPSGDFSFHTTPWIYYKFLTLEEATVLAALRNLGIMVAKGRKSIEGLHYKEINGAIWFWCSVKKLCYRFNISSNTEKRIIANLAKKGVLSKKTQGMDHRRYLHIEMKTIQTLIDKALKDSYD